MGKQSQIIIFRVVSGRPDLGLCLRLPHLLSTVITSYLLI
jgi:hypothetical protein